MDGAAVGEDGAEKRPHNGDGVSENSVGSSAEDTTDIKQSSLLCMDCGLTFAHPEVFKTHLHQHALEEEEEKEEAQTRVNGDPAAELDCGRGDNGEHGDEVTGSDEDECDMSSSLQTNPSGSIQGVGVASVKEKLRNIFTCLVCGKVYTYLVSFRKHQQMHENEAAKEKSGNNLHMYECPECGMSFIRQARLLSHLRVHRPPGSFTEEPLRCDQCDRDFTSVKSWMAHVDLHKQKPFWCLSCSKGYTDEGALETHLQSHKLKQHTCNICRKSFHMATQLMHHYRSHTGAKPYQCTFCGKRFSYPASLISHRKRHLRGRGRSSGMPLRIKNSAITAKEQSIKKNRHIFTSDKDELEMDTNMEELPGNEPVEKGDTQNQIEDAELGDHSNSDESDCGEPSHHFKPSKPPGMAGCDPHDESVEPQMGQVYENDSQETHMHREHKYWEWECCECDMGFDDVAMLHLHYIKHATGELPMAHDEIGA